MQGPEVRHDEIARLDLERRRRDPVDAHAEELGDLLRVLHQLTEQCGCVGAAELRSRDHPERAGVVLEWVEVEERLDVESIGRRPVGVHVPVDVAVEQVAVALGVGVVVAEQGAWDGVHPRIPAEPLQLVALVDERRDDPAGLLLEVGIGGAVVLVLGIEELRIFPVEDLLEPLADPRHLLGEPTPEHQVSERLEPCHLLRREPAIVRSDHGGSGARSRGSGAGRGRLSAGIRAAAPASQDPCHTADGSTGSSARPPIVAAPAPDPGPDRNLLWYCEEFRQHAEQGWGALVGEQTTSFLTHPRGLAPGFVVGFAVPFEMKGTGSRTKNRARFPHVAGLGLADATPDLLLLVAEFSAAGGRTGDEILDTTAATTGVDRTRLRRFASNLFNRGYLVSDPPPPRWTEPPELDDSRATPRSDSQYFRIPEGTAFVVDGGEFLWFDHHGTLRLRLSPQEMLAARVFGEPHTADQAWGELALEPTTTIARAAFDELVDRLRTSGILRTSEAVEEERTQFEPIEADARAQILAATIDAVAEFQVAAAARPGQRVAVVPVNDDHNMAPLSLGLLVAYAQELDGGRLKDRYDFIPLFLAEEHTLLEFTDRPAIYLFSNYIWNYERNLKLSAMLKEANPNSLMIHGGPSTPKYTGDCIEFFVDNPHVDITVRGEGEATFAAILDALDGSDLGDLSPLDRVAGLSYRGPNGVVDTEDRERIADLDTIPSPYLLGLLDPFGAAHSAAVVESNRGCPYGCTFCDWGSATLSRIRKFDMDRVKAELEWFSKNELLFVSLCDANFGIFERDVEVAEHIAAMKAKYGYPKTAALNYAKNTMKHLRRIIQIFTDAGLTIEPTIALQSTDVATLKVIKRSNIKLSQYDELADGFRRARLPLATDVMMGLPGSTLTVLQGRPPGVHRSRRPGAVQPDRAPAEQPHERPGVPGRARHRRSTARVPQGDEDLLPRRLRRDGAAAGRVLRLRQLRDPPPGRTLRAQRDRHEGGRLLRPPQPRRHRTTLASGPSSLRWCG